jgi:hypothetical protein
MVVIGVSLVVVAALTVVVARHPRTYVVPDPDPGYRETPRIRVGDLVAYTGPDEPELPLWEGQPGLVLEIPRGADDRPIEYVAAFVAGPSACTTPDDTEQVDEATYVERGRRVAAGRHPLRDEPVEVSSHAAPHWPEGGPQPRS